jgi:hypothetical protein
VSIPLDLQSAQKVHTPVARGGVLGYEGLRPHDQFVHVRHGSLLETHGFQLSLQAKAFYPCFFPLGFEYLPILEGLEFNHHVQHTLLFRRQLCDSVFNGTSLTRTSLIHGAQLIIMHDEPLFQFDGVGEQVYVTIPFEIVQVGGRHLRLAFLVPAICISPANTAIRARVSAHALPA